MRRVGEVPSTDIREGKGKKEKSIKCISRGNVWSDMVLENRDERKGR